MLHRSKPFFSATPLIPGLGSYAVHAPPPIEFPSSAPQYTKVKTLQESADTIKYFLSIIHSFRDFERQAAFSQGKSHLAVEPKIPPPTLKVLNTEIHPFPKFWIKTYHLRPSVVVLIDNCTVNVNNLILLAVPLDPDTKGPLSNARLECAAEVVNEELTAELQPKYGARAFKFSDMKVHRSLRLREISFWLEKKDSRHTQTHILIILDYGRENIGI